MTLRTVQRVIIGQETSDGGGVRLRRSLGSAQLDHLDPSARLGVLSEGDALAVKAGEKGMRLLVIAAKPILEPIARYGPFVMNTREEIMQAMQDFQAGNF